MNKVAFLSSVEEELFKDIEIPLRYFNIICEELRALRSRADDKSIAIQSQANIQLTMLKVH